jgi:hypothetical protein
MVAMKHLVVLNQKRNGMGMENDKLKQQKTLIIS